MRNSIKLFQTTNHNQTDFFYQPTERCFLPQKALHLLNCGIGMIRTNALAICRWIARAILATWFKDYQVMHPLLAISGSHFATPNRPNPATALISFASQITPQKMFTCLSSDKQPMHCKNAVPATSFHCCNLEENREDCAM